MLVTRIDVARADRKGANEKNMVRIPLVEGDEVLGYYGRGREEHSGEPVAAANRVPRNARHGRKAHKP